MIIIRLKNKKVCESSTDVLMLMQFISDTPLQSHRVIEPEMFFLFSKGIEKTEVHIFVHAYMYQMEKQF